MSEKENSQVPKTYSFLLETHPVSGDPLEAALTPKYGSEKAGDQSGTHRLIGRKLGEDLATEDPILAGFADPSLPTYIASKCADPLNASATEVLSVVSTQGANGLAWGKVVNNFADSL